MAIKAKHVATFTDSNNNPRNVYTLSGPKAELEAYKEAQGEFYSEDDATGAPLYYDKSCVYGINNLALSRQGNYYVEDPARKVNAIIDSVNPLVAQQLAIMEAQRIMDAMGGTATQTASTPVSQSEAVTATESDDDLGGDLPE